MRVSQRYHLIWLLLLVTIASPPRPALAASEAEPASGSVTGRVVDAQGRGVAGATVRLQESRGDEVLTTATSDADGKFLLDRVPIGCRRMMLVDAEGMGREYRPDIDVFPGLATELGEVRVLPGFVCQGRIVDAEDRPAAGVVVVVEAFHYELGHTINRLGPTWEIKSDADGRFTSPALPPCYATFTAKAPAGQVQAGYCDQMIGPEAAQNPLADLRLVPEVLVEGVVTDLFGLPINGAEVWYVSHGADPVKTDARGHFALHGMTDKRAHNARVGVDAAGFGSYFDEKSKDELSRKIALKPCGYIGGHAVDAETGEAVSIERVVVCEVRRDADGTPHSHGCGEARFEQPRQGEFRVDVSNDGEKHLTVMADGYHTAEEYVLGFDLLGPVPQVTIKMRRAGSTVSAARQRIRGVVRAEGRPAGQVWVSLWQKKKEWDRVNSWVRRGRTVDGSYRPWNVDVLTAADGSYLLDVMDPGEYYVTAHPSRGAAALSAPLAIATDQELTCDLDLPTGGTLRGRVAGVSPELAERLWVVAFGHAPFRATVTFDRDGTFAVRDVPPGEIGLKVGHDGHLDADVARYPIPREAWDQTGEPWKWAVRVTVRENQETDGIELEYPAPGAPDKVDD